MSYGFKILVEGDYACFTRSEFKVERVSYDVPTPGALEGMLKSIYWKPSIRYVIDEIVVFNPIDFANIRRNEVKDKVLLSAMKSRMNGKGGEPEIYTSECRNQRAAMVLKNVKYGIAFHFELTGLKNEEETDGEKKHYNIIKRRIEKGQWFRQPCFGCSEFPVRRIDLIDDFDYDLINSTILNPAMWILDTCVIGSISRMVGFRKTTTGKIQNFQIGQRPCTIIRIWSTV